MRIIVHFTDVYQRKILDKILPNYKKYPILILCSGFVLIVEPLLVSRTYLIPKVQIIIASPPFPLLVTPRIPQLYQSHRSIINSQLSQHINTIV